MVSNTLYFFGVGGTGALVVEPLLMLCAAGIGPSRLSVMLIDADAGSPAFARAQELIRQYNEVRDAFGHPEDGFFRTELIRTAPSESVWSPLGSGDPNEMGDLTLEKHVQRARMTGNTRPAATLLDVLFSPEQQKERLREGFRGNPAIGSVLMHGLKQSSFFRQFLNGARGDTSAAFFAAGSIFGGTGAAALPVLAEILVGEGIDAADVGAALLTPYYALGEPGPREQQDGRLKPDSSLFLRNTAAALPTYTRGHSRYGTLYVLGDEQSLPQPRSIYSAGGHDQRNDPHAVELFAALAALDFAERDRPRGQVTRMFYATVEGEQPGWRDLPIGEEQREKLVTFLTASNFFLTYFGPSRSGAEQQHLIEELRTQTWLRDIGLDADFLRSRAADVDRLGSYFASVWGYLRAVSENHVPLRLVSFADSGTRRLPAPPEYARARAESEFVLPRVDNCLESFSPRQRKKTLGIFGKGGEDRLTSLAEIFHWYNLVQRGNRQGLGALLFYLQEGTRNFVREWYSHAPSRS